MKPGMTLFYAAMDKNKSKDAKAARDVAYSEGENLANKKSSDQYNYEENTKIDKTSWIDIVYDLIKKVKQNGILKDITDVFEKSFYNAYKEKTQQVSETQEENLKPVYYSQLDERWANEPYNSVYYDIGKSGCGVTSMAMIISSLSSQNVTPLDMAEYSKSIDTAKEGTDISFFSKAAKKYGLEATDSYWVYSYYVDKVINDLNEGSMYIANLKPGSVWSGGHFLVITEYQQKEDGNWFVAYDPNYSKGKNYYKNNVIIDENVEGKIYIPEEVLKEDWGYMIGISAKKE